MTRALRVYTSAAFVSAFALAAPNAGAQWTEATSTVPHNAGITFAPAATRAVRVSWKPWNLVTPGLKYHLMRATDATSAGSDISGPITALTFTDAAVPPGSTFYYWVTVDGTPPPGGKPGPAGMQFVSGRVPFTLVMQAVALPTDAGNARGGGRAAPTQQTTAQPPPAPIVPTISRLVPNVIPIGSPTFVVRGMHLALVTAVKVGGVVQAWQKESCTGFDGADTSYVVTIAAPVPGATTVELTSPTGTMAAPLTVEGATISSIAPDVAKPGDWVTITGTQLADFQYSYTAGTCKTVKMSATGPTSVKFGGVAATAVRGVAGAGALTAQVPARGSGPITVTTAVHGAARSPVAFLETPTIISMSPTTAQPNDVVTIVGTALDIVNQHGVEMAVQPTASQGQGLMTLGPSMYDTLRVRMDNPYRGTTVVYIILKNSRLPGGRVNFGTVSNQLTLLMPLRVTAVSPNPAAHGIAVTITGTGLADPPAGAPAGWVPVVTFNGTPATGVRIGNATTIYATVPAGATTGPVKVGAVVGPVVTISP